jgi:hypothetical protein
MTATLTWWPELDLLDRCDRCGAEARVRALFSSGADLLFCGHHARRFENTLFEQAVVVQRSPD